MHAGVFIMQNTLDSEGEWAAAARSQWVYACCIGWPKCTIFTPVCICENSILTRDEDPDPDPTVTTDLLNYFHLGTKYKPEA